MSVKTYDQLIASFPDNSTGLITPSSMRDLVDSIELKYDNYTVVKPGQPNGNKFPDPSGGVITLPDDTVWVINGAVTVQYPIVCGDNVTIVGLSKSYTNDQILLDPAAGAVALLNSSASGNQLYINNVLLSAAGGTGRLFDIEEPLVMAISSVAIIANDLGTVSFAGGLGNLNFVDRCVMIGTGTALQVTGAADRLVFDGLQSGFVNAGIQIDIQGTANAVFIRNCYNNSSFAMFQADEATTTAGVINNNAVEPGKELITGVERTSINWVFNGNSGISNTHFGGSLNMDLNATSTVNGGANVWVPIVGNGLDTLYPGATWISRSNDLELTYDGNEVDKRTEITLTASVKRATGTTATRFSIGLEKNGELLFTPKSVSLASITRVTTTATATLSAAFPLLDGMSVTVSGADQPEYNGTFVISNVAGLTFDYTMASDPGASATGALLAEVPIEFVSHAMATGDNITVDMHAETDLNNGDTIVPVIRPSAGTPDFIVESISLIIL